MVLSEFPELEAGAAKLLFIAVSERWVEGLHAAVKKSIAKAPHAGAVHVAFSRAIGPVASLLERQPHQMMALSRLARQVRSPAAALKRLGL